MDILHKLKRLKVGDKITIYKLNIYNEPSPIHCTLINNEFKQCGYMCKSGGWAYSKIEDNDIPCYEVIVRLYKNKNWSKFRTSFEIVDVEKGWI